METHSCHGVWFFNNPKVTCCQSEFYRQEAVILANLGIGHLSVPACRVRDADRCIAQAGRVSADRFFLRESIHGGDWVGDVIIDGRREGIVICRKFNQRRGTGDWPGESFQINWETCFLNKKPESLHLGL